MTPDDETPVSPHTGIDGNAANAQYLEHLDGLRAVALVGVLLFHFDLHASGGFLGVDLFFVLSGFLISRNLAGTTCEGAATQLFTFYRRRFWRLYPSVLFTVAWTATLAIGFMPHSWVIPYANSAFATLACVSNVLFYTEAGYWDAAAKTKPLLHTWSLAVEEQFYLIWPCVLLLVTHVASPHAATDSDVTPQREERRIGASQTLTRTAAIGALGALSFGAAQWWYQKDPALVFFMMPFRMWEFCVGALLVDIYPYVTIHASSLLGEALAFLSFAVIIASYVFVTESIMALWNAVAIIPCVFSGALLVLLPHSFVARRLLRNGALRFLGKVSYSVYLVHWPLRTASYAYRFVYRDTELDVSPERIGTALCLCSIILGTLQYAFIESSARLVGRADQAGMRTIFAMACSVLVTLGLVLALRFGLSSSSLMDSLWENDKHGADSFSDPPQQGLEADPIEQNLAADDDIFFASITEMCEDPAEPSNSHYDDPLSNAIARSCFKYPVELPIRTKHDWYCFKGNRTDADRSQNCELGNVENGSRSNVVFLGDSMMLALRPAIYNVGLHLNTSFMMHAWSGCRADLAKVFQHHENSDCKSKFYDVKMKLTVLEPSVVIVTEYMDGWCGSRCSVRLQRTFDWIRSLGHRVVMILNPPKVPLLLVNCVKERGAAHCPRTYAMDARIYSYNRAVQGALRALDVPFIDLYPAFRVPNHTASSFPEIPTMASIQAKQQVGNAFTLLIFGDWPVNMDDHHLSIAGAIAAAPLIETALIQEIHAFTQSLVNKSM
ncbi:O-acetyltransferase OatA [Porphyridium purpureum]|uniref:O-acetyltransferase OatA n=1 Tax=Porphyridium purpureum TaxID=35688 RepID=A0A5J4YZ63_PORPP|nr:O-acetyltransferase OatA [Porphyridium purpureum]|eukprot:POR5062..scf209_3